MSVSLEDLHDEVEAAVVALFSGATLDGDALEGIAQHQRAISDDLLRRALAIGGVTLFGAGTLGRQALAEARAAGVPVKQFIDNRAPLVDESLLDGTPIRPPSAIDDNDIVVVAVGSGVSGIRGELVEQRGVLSYGLDRFCHLLGLSRLAPSRYIAELAANAGRYQWLSRRVGDAESRAVLRAVVYSRLTLDETPLIEVQSKHAQWFEQPFFAPNSAHVFVDGGAFNGDTVAGFLAANGKDFAKIYAFEPDTSLAEFAVTRYHDDPRIRIIPAGLSLEPGFARFAKTELTNGSLLGDSTACPGVEVRVTSVDAFVSRPITFLKLDVEGNEKNALQGARHHISRDRPAMALAVYHRPEDIWAIPTLVDKMLPGFRYALRHYTDTSFETVLYATHPGETVNP